MITFICCSIRPEMAQTLEQNIKDTIGIPYEFIAHDNREAKYGICKVYNDYAQKAKYDYLCFLHEDVQFNTPNWGDLIVKKLQETDCGVIGFAGSIIKHSIPSGWAYSRKTKRQRLIQHRKDRPSKNVLINPKGEDFAQVITLDGLCLFVRKDIWSEYPFSELQLPGFHGYDIDFSISVAQHYKNYVCYTIEVEHFSTGSLNEEWVKSVKVIHKKWRDKLPMYTPEWVNHNEYYNTTKAKYQATRYVMKNLKSLDEANGIGFRFFKEHWNNSYYSWKMLMKIMSDKFKTK